MNGGAHLTAGDTELTLRLTGYAFDEADNDWDANWLVVSVDVSTPQRSWQATDRALLTWEVRELIGWLRTVADGTDDGRGFSGLEGSLQFEAADIDGTPVLTVVFWRDLTPTSIKEDEIPVAFTLTAEALRRFADEIAAAAGPFPVRVVETDGYASKIMGGPP